MLATKILAEGHAEFMGLIDQLDGVRNDLTAHKRTFNQMKSLLLLHMRQEEEIFYPALAQYDEFSDQMENSVSEHEMVKGVLAQLSELDPGDNVFQSELATMKAALKVHATQEEEDIFPRAEEVLGFDAVNALGNEIDRMKGEADISRGASM